MHDLISYNCPEIIKNVTKLPTKLSSFPTDHYIIKFQSQQAFSRAKAVKRIVFVYLRGNFDGLRSFFSRMLVTMERMVFKGCPKMYSRKTVKDINSPPWIDGEVRHFI